MKYVIIGNSAAGIGAVEGIRQVDKHGEITIVSSEPHHTYSRPLISYLLLGKTSEEKMRYRGDQFYADNNCKLLAGVSVTKIDSAKKHVSLSNGENLPYDRLMVATGSSAFVPTFEGLEGVTSSHTFMSLDDAHGLANALGTSKRVLIVGAGLIGLKCAEGILDKVQSITIVDLAPRVLSSILDGSGAARIQEHLEKKGISFKLSAGVERFEGNKAVLSNGETEEFDILVLAVGVKPNTYLLNDIANIGRGIIVDSRSKTSVPDIYAAGDCTQTIDVVSGQEKIMALLPNAYMQGEVAGINMAGGNKKFDKAIAMNAIGFFGLHMLTAGSYSGEVYEKSDKDYSKRLFYSNNKLNGFILIGDIDRAGIYTSLIRERTPLDSIDFPLICEQAGLMAFSREHRDARLGGDAG